MVQAISAPRRINVISSALPAWIPPAGQVGIVPLTNTLASIDSCPANNCTWSGGVGGNYLVLNAESGACDAYGWGQFGGQIRHGSGHAASDTNEVIILEYGLNGATWVQLVSPLDDPILLTSTCIETSPINWGEVVGHIGELGSNHSYAWPSYWPPEFGGGAKGSFVMPCACAIGTTQSTNTRRAHRVDLDNLSARWQRFTDGVTEKGASSAPVGVAAFDGLRNGFWAHSRFASTSLSFLQCPTAVWTTRGGLTTYGTTKQKGLSPLWHIPSKDILVAIVSPADDSPLKVVWAQLGATIAATTGWHQATLTGVLFPFSEGLGGDVTDDERIFAITEGDKTGIYQLVIPDDYVDDPWEFIRYSYQDSANPPYWNAGEAAAAWTFGQQFARQGPWKGFGYAKRLGCFVYPQIPEGNSNINLIPANQRVLSWKPPAS